MRTFVKVLALCLLGLVAAPLLQAQQVISTLTCVDSILGHPNLTLPVYAFYFDTKNSGSDFNTAFYFSAYADVSRYNQLANAAINDQNTYADCQFSGSNVYAYNVSLEDIAAFVSPSESYTLATFSFDLVGIPSSTKAPAKKAVMTADEKARALAAFEAKIPPLAKQ